MSLVKKDREEWFRQAAGDVASCLEILALSDGRVDVDDAADFIGKVEELFGLTVPESCAAFYRVFDVTPDGSISACDRPALSEAARALRAMLARGGSSMEQACGIGFALLEIDSLWEASLPTDDGRAPYDPVYDSPSGSLRYWDRI